MNIAQIPIPSTNFRPGRSVAVDTIVYHWIAGNLADADAVFTKVGSELSAHFAAEDNNAHQYVRLGDTAYHARQENSRSVAIEHSAQPGRDASPATMETSAQLVVQIARYYGRKVNDFRHIPHGSVVNTQCPGTLNIDAIVRRAKDLEAFMAVPSQIVLASATVSVPLTFWIKVTVPQLRARLAPTTASPDRPDKLLVEGDDVECGAVVSGSDPYGDGRNLWLHTVRSGLYLWAGGTNYQHTTNNA